VTIRLQGDVSTSLASVEKIFGVHNSAYPFTYTFVDEDFAEKFKTINMTSTLASLFATLTIIITGLGLFGLAAFTAEQRTKEIGIRKVLGASVSSLLSLIAKDFSKLVIVSFMLSSPLAWWLLNWYLERYPIRTEITWWIFPLTGIVALSFALIIVITQVLRATKANPASSLRSE
jgi:ABC-type antimicrobial peptide transport system permease subunit